MHYTYSNPYKHYTAEKLADWRKIKRDHPSAIVRSHKTSKGITRLAIYGTGSHKEVIPIEFMRYRKHHKNPQLPAPSGGYAFGDVQSTRNNSNYPYTNAADLAYFRPNYYGPNFRNPSVTNMLGMPHSWSHNRLYVVLGASILVGLLKILGNKV